MVFSDLFFIFAFLPAFIICYILAYYIDRKWFSTEMTGCTKARNLVLVLFSLLFYAWGEPVYVFLMLGSVFINYLVGIAISRQTDRRKTALVIGLICNILILGIFKYAGFFAQTLNDVGIPVSIPHISLPIGISFYTFQAISYIIDVYRRQAPVQHRFVDLLLYISMFPQLIAGPIVRYDIVAKQINDRSVTMEDIVEGSFRFLIGLGKKVILANMLSEISGQFLDGDFNNLTTAGAWVGIVAYTLQIFFDFSGYSDMAIGLGRCLGFHFAENFTHPYCCKTITEFWRRWHMSLGSFFRDYVYIPMGGNRKHQSLNILVVWFLTGMWHGASWNFILWGLYFGFIVTVEKFTLLKVKDYIPSLFLHVYSMFLVIVGWGIFYFDNMNTMGRFFGIFFGGAAQFSDFTVESALLNNFWLWIVALLFCMPVYDSVKNLAIRVIPQNTFVGNSIALCTRLSLSIVLLFISVALLVGATNNAFIYTRF
ncbi:MBOAT family protein [uncultured Bacteroides sp.]|uniref:MBOAT family O-acyltransferase n=1 Tax=uncultured Bacteroides sp. TaxID=162156 RepID=UPI00261AF983|nr:MBOAT family O-acyltransferase [uncultured Bacteroides sp.]